MVTINSEIQRILKDKNLTIKTGTQTMLGILDELQSQVIDEIGRAAIDSWDAYHLKQMQDSIKNQIENFKAKAKAEAYGLLEDSWGKGQTLVDIPPVCKHRQDRGDLYRVSYFNLGSRYSQGFCFS